MVLAAPAPSADALCRMFGTAGKAAELDKRCSSTPSMAGPRIGIFRSSAAPGYIGPAYGSIRNVTGTVMAAATAAAVKAYFDAFGVPWPRATTRTARRYARTRYNVYQIFYFDKRAERVDAYKYGITRVGERRPKSQLRACALNPRTHTEDCRYKWIRVRILGWHRARRIEGAYCARYVAARHRRPYGMTRCL